MTLTPERVTITWHRDPRDTDRSFEAFTVYRDLGPGRTLQRAAEVLRQRGIEEAEREGRAAPNRSIESIAAVVRRWAAEHTWKDRAAKYDDDADLEWQEQVKYERGLAARRHVRSAKAMQAKALQALQSLDATQMDAADLVRMLTAAVKIERDAYGMDDSSGRQVGPQVNIIIDPRMVAPPTATPPPIVVDPD